MKSTISISKQIKEKNKIDEKLSIIKTINLLHNVLSSDHVMITNSPIETIVINNAIDLEKYNQLNDESPKLKDIILHNKTITSNQPIMLHSNSLCQLNITNKDDFIMSSLWKIFIEYHSSNSFCELLSNLFNIKNNKDLVMNMKIEYRMPIFSDYIPESPKTLNNDIICYGIYIMKKKDDDSLGGNLEIYFQEKRVLNILYQSNCLILLKNITSRNDIKIKLSKRHQTMHSHRILTFSLITKKEIK
jgi:hypothetical protein